MSDPPTPRSKSSHGSPRPEDSWYTLVQEDVLVSTPSPSPTNQSGSPGSSRASSKAGSASSTHRQDEHLTASTDEAKSGASALLQSSTLSQHPLEDESQLSDGAAAPARGGLHPDEPGVAPLDVISPLGGLPISDDEQAHKHLDVPSLDLDASMNSQDGRQLSQTADVTGGITRETFPFVEDDSGTMASSDTDIPIPLSDAEDNEGNISDEMVGRHSGRTLPQDAVQEAIAEVSADFVSGALQMSVSQHSFDVDEESEKVSVKDLGGAIDSVTKVQDSQDAQSSAATTPWQSEPLTPSPYHMDNSSGHQNGVQHADPRNVARVDVGSEYNVSRNGFSMEEGVIQDELEQGRIASPAFKATPSAKDLTQGSPSKFPLDMDNLQPLYIEEHVAAGAQVIVLKETDTDYRSEKDDINSIPQGRGSQPEASSSRTEDKTLLDGPARTVPSALDERIGLEGSSRDSLPFRYLSPTEKDMPQSDQESMQYPRGSSQNIGFSSDSESHHSSEVRQDRNGDRILRNMGAPQMRQDRETEGDLLARRVALLLQVNKEDVPDRKEIMRQIGSLSGSASSSNTGSPDSIEEASLPMGIFSRSSETQRRGDGQTMPPVSRSVSSSSSTDSLAEHVKRLLQESESLRKLHEAGIDPRQLLNIQTEIGKSSPTHSEASTSSSVREIIDRVTKHSKAEDENYDGSPRQDEVFMSPSPTMSGSMSVPMGSGSGRSREEVRVSNKITFQQTFKSSNSRECLRSVDTSRSSLSTLTHDSLSQRVEHLLHAVDRAASHTSVNPNEPLSREDLLALMQVSELEKQVSQGNIPVQRPFSPRSVQNSHLLSAADGRASSASVRETSGLSADSLAIRVQAILGREAPGERVDRIISEALSSADPSTLSRNQSNVSVGSRYSTARSYSSASPRDLDDSSIADVLQQPYGAFEKARDLLTLHLQRIADRTFDHSMDTRTPFRQDTNANIVNMRHYSASAQSSQHLSDRDFQTASSGSLGKPLSSEHVHYGLLPDQIPQHLQMASGTSREFRPLPRESSAAKHKSWHGYDPHQQAHYSSSYSGGQDPRNENLSKHDSSHEIDDSLFAVPRSNSSPNIKVDKHRAKAASSHQRSGSWGRSQEFQHLQQSTSPSKVPVSSRVAATTGQTSNDSRQQQEYPSQPKSQTPKHLPSQQQPAVHQEYSTNSWPRSQSKSRSSGGLASKKEAKQSPATESRQSLGKDSLLADGFLRPYRPPGSSDVIYTYPIDEQGMQASGSPTISNSTVESSHPGSDDAHAPSFPKSAYGSRTSKDSSDVSLHSSKIPRYERGTAPASSPLEMGHHGATRPADELEARRYTRSYSDSSRPDAPEKETARQTMPLDSQHRYGASGVSPTARSPGKKRERSPPESSVLAQMAACESRQKFDSHRVMNRGSMLGSGLPASNFSSAVEPAGARKRKDSPDRLGYRVPTAAPQWDASRQGQQPDPAGRYLPNGQSRQQYPMSSGATNAPPPGVTSPSKIPRYGPGIGQDSVKYAQGITERDGRRVSGRSDYSERQHQKYGPGYRPEVPQLPGTFSRRVLEDILQNEADPLYREASLMWEEYQRLQEQKEAFREARREMRGGATAAAAPSEESDMSSLDSRRVNRLAHFVQDPVRHTVEQLVPDESDTSRSSSSTLTDSTPRRRRKWDRDQQQFTPREQSPDTTSKPLDGFQRKVSPEEIAAIVQTSSKESRIPRTANMQHQQQEKRKMPDDRRHSKHSRGGERQGSRHPPTSQDGTTQEMLSDLAMSEQALLKDISLESDRLLQLLGPDGIRKLSSKLVKLQRKIDRQREQHRKREEEQKQELARRTSTKGRGQQEDIPKASTPAVDDLSSSVISSSAEESSDVTNGHRYLGKQASLEPALSPVQETSIKSAEVSASDKRPGRTSNAAKRRKDFAHRDDFGVTYTTDSLSDIGSDTSSSIPCACKPTRSHSIHGMTKRSREKATGRMSKETKLDVERDEVFKKSSEEPSRRPYEEVSRIPVRDPDAAKRRNVAGGAQVQERPQGVKPGMAFVVDVGHHAGRKEQAKDNNVLTRRQNYSNKDAEEEEDEERRRRRSEKKAGQQLAAKENEAPSRIPKKIVQPVAWFQPMNKKMPWQQDTPTKAKPQPITIPVKTEEDVARANDKASLQEAFEKHRSDFISKSRERQRKMRLAAEERQVQAQYELERAQIFHDQRSKKPNPNAHPLSDQLHKPKKRAISRKQMKEQTEKLYNRLPEVKEKEKEKKKIQDSELNRIRAQMYRKKLSDKVKKKPWTGN